MTRYFPEVVAAVKANLPARCVVDAELVVPDADGRRLDFDALLLHITRGQPGRPAGRPDGPAGRLRPARPGRDRLHG